MFVSTDLLADHSRIWIYQCNRELKEAEILTISEETRKFLESWTAHDQALKAGFEIRYHRFLILMVDEKAAGASGCSIDKSVHFIQSLESKYGVSFFDRMRFAYKSGSRVEAVPRNEFASLYANGMLDGNTIVFNNLINTKKELDGLWEVPLKSSWHHGLINS